MRNPLRSALILIATLTALAFAACGEDDGAGGDLGPDPATVAAPDSLLYAEAVIRPEGEQKDDLLAALAKLTGDDDPGAAIREEIERSIAEEGDLTYEDDIEPWLGQRAGVFLLDFSADQGDAAVVIATTDADATRATLEKASEASEEPEQEATYEGVTYTVDDSGDAVGIVGDFLVGGTEAGFRAAVDAAGGDSLAENAEVTEGLGSAPEESLFRAYLDGAGLVERAIEAGEARPRDLAPFEEQIDALEEGPIVVSGGATEDSMTIEVAAPEGAAGTAAPGAGDLLSALPGDSWLAVAVPALGEAIGSGYENLVSGLESGFEGLPKAEIPDVRGEVEAATGLDLSKDLAWAGDTALFIQGSSPLGLGGGLLIETADEEAATDAVDKLGSALRRNRSIEVEETATGFRLQSRGQPVGAEVAVEDQRVVLAAGATTIDDVLDPAETLADSEAFGDAAGALGDELDPSLYLDMDAVVALLEATGAGTGDPSYEAAKPTLDAIDYVIAGAAAADGRSSARLVLGLRDAPSGEGTAAALVP